MKKPENHKLIELINKAMGNQTLVAKTLGVSRQSIWKWCKDDPELQAALDQSRETMLDNAESKLYSNALNGDTTSLIFFLKTQGKRRGYIEKQQIEQSGEIKMYGIDAPVEDV